MDNEMLRDLPEEYAALGDRRTVMREVAASLKELHTAITRVGDAIEGAGLPGRDWRSDDASLRRLSRKFPDITVDDLITRLAEFAAGTGPQWLRGGSDELDAFHNEVADLYDILRPLAGGARRRSGSPDRERRMGRLERVLAEPRVAEPLDDISMLLGDLAALRPYMGPLSPGEWEHTSEVGIAPGFGWVGEQAGGPGNTLRRTLPVPPGGSRSRLRDFAPAKGGKNPLGQLAAFVAPLGGWMRRVGARRMLRNELIGIAVLLVVGTGAAVLEARLPHVASPVIRPPASSTETAEANGTPSPPLGSPTATRPPAPLPKLALTCAMTAPNAATLTLKNTGTAALTWQASSNRLAISPAQGSLAVGQSVKADVTPKGDRFGGTITVSATSGTRSASYSVTCS